MELLNIVELQKPDGYCSVEIYNGDITKLETPVDLLVVSAFRNSFVPTPGTVIGALYRNLSIDIERLFIQEKLNLREGLNCWITDKADSDLYKRIMIVEMLPGWDNDINIDDIFRNMFIAISVMAQMGYEIKTVALPSLGTGNQMLDFTETINSLLTRLDKHIQNNLGVERIMFVEYDKEKSRKLSDALDKTLNRVSFKLPVDEMIENLKDDILKSIHKNASDDFLNTETFTYLKRTFENSSARSVEYGLACRRLAEKMISDMYFRDSTSKLTFLQKIRKIAKNNVAQWIVTYLHLIRVFGNEAAHEIGGNDIKPRSIAVRDITLLLFSTQRVVEFWAENK
jgi:O-acetyl-ADP-ribose deacetylase (regulator of RNase III)